MKIGIFGGTFDPVHIGHLILAQTALEQLRLDEIWFVPVYLPPHKLQSGLADAPTRLKLLQLAVKSNPQFRVNDVEIRRGGKSYTFDTLNALKEQFPDNHFYLLIGEDLLSARWRNWEDIKRAAQICVFRRAKPLLQTKPSVAADSSGVRFMDMPAIEISSTEIRRRLSRGKSVRYWVPESVRPTLEKLQAGAD